MELRREYKITWQRKGQVKKRIIYQTLKGAVDCAERQRTAAAEMTWLQTPLSPIVYGPMIESREVGPWSYLVLAATG